MVDSEQPGRKNTRNISVSILSQNVVDYLRDEATLASVSSGKILEKWIQQPVNLLYLLMLIVVAIRLFISIAHGLLMLLLKTLL
ncbi:hypothetical protein CJF24_15325 [Aeromonas veronii]|uniref:Uncharacterized protein n=1 Tax=Aeromonas veronii TaxID=654 RepID=A0ABY3MJ33_AERVE|nr:hypothetical protein CGZ72_08880 [Aeromonas veronii]RDU89483.1 hypothetical protein CGZ76_04795 [Aeromonas veronii]TEY49894.1 hypothetical protein CIG14_13490 [Aeromonas veronii]TEY81746.1 hypothetical protein CIG16_05265 [Aeromonas veronii]TYD42724.1 hypothetical protein CJF24_15325 [Aeromonas veronii]